MSELEQAHETLPVLDSELTGAYTNGLLFEKERFAIFIAFEKLDYMLLGDSLSPSSLITESFYSYIQLMHWEPTVSLPIIYKIHR